MKTDQIRPLTTHPRLVRHSKTSKALRSNAENTKHIRRPEAGLTVG